LILSRGVRLASAPGTLRVSVLLYVAAIGLAEACAAFVSLWGGLLLHAGLILALLNHYVLATTGAVETSERDEPPHPFLDVLLVLSLVPQLRVLSLSMAVESVPDRYAYAIVGAPLLLAAVLAARFVTPPGLARHLRPGSWWQAPLALSGLPLGSIGYLIAGPERSIVSGGSARIFAAAAVIVFLAGLLEELLFRGLIQGALERLFGWGGPLLGSALFGFVYLGVGAASYWVFIAVLGVVFASVVARTGTVLGVGIAHGLLNVSVLIVWPSVLD